MLIQVAEKWMAVRQKLGRTDDTFVAFLVPFGRWAAATYDLGAAPDLA